MQRAKINSVVGPAQPSYGSPPGETIPSPQTEPAAPGAAAQLDNFALDLGPAMPSRRVLVVDDSRVIRLKVSKTLKKAGFDVETAENGMVGIEKALIYRPVLILLDINMPEMDGWEATRLIRSYPELKDTVVVILSSNSQRADVQYALTCGAHSYLTKPVSDEHLIAHIEKALEPGTSGASSKGDRPFDKALAKKRSEVKTVLIVDDSNLIRLKIKRTLADVGCKLLEAKDGDEACRMAAQHRPNLILMDINMPHIDGVEATRRIRKNAALSNTVIMALTANSNRSDVAKALGAGMNDYMVKPFTNDQLIERVMHHLTEGRS